jgi:nucleotidyltransferase substrate binding protein (TIGR01987 family)
MSTLDFSPLKKAIQQLADGIKQADKDPQSELLRDGVIQRFEYTFELAIKFIRRVLEVEFGDPVDTMTLRDVLRSAYERQLILDPTQWFVFRDQRNKTSHTYDANVAVDVYKAAAPFLDQARILIDRLHDL